MTAAVHVLCGPAGAGKTRRLIERFLEVAQSEPGAALWLGSTRRNIEALRQQLLLPGDACLAPQIFTLSDFVAEVIQHNDSAARPLSEVQRRLLTEDVVADLHARGELAHFHRVIDTRGFADGIFALIAELKRREVRPEQLEAAAAGAKDRQCARIYAEYQRRLQRHHLHDLEGRFWHARDLLSRGPCPPFETVRAVFVDGFSDFTPTQHDLLTALCQWVEELWIALPDEAGSERAELFAQPRETLRRLLRLRPHIDYLFVGRIGNPSEEPDGLVIRPTGLDGLAIRPTGPDGLPIRPTGLAHVERQLFRPPQRVAPAECAEGLFLIEAPGVVGEVRLVARQIKSLLLEGQRAEHILVTMRDVLPYADLVREVFDEYGIPLDVEGAEPLIRNPVVATLLRALRLPDDEWPFAAVTALLRSDYFRPDWTESHGRPNLAQHAEVLLRLLGEPRHRDAYLEAVRRWAESPPPGLEDEEAEESRRRRKHELAQSCRPFLERFFHTWDRLPVKAGLVEHIDGLRRLADDLGIVRAAVERPRDAAAWQRFSDELECWRRLDEALHGPERLLDRREFYRRLLALAGQAGLARTPRGPGRVRVLSAELVRGLEAPYLFVLGLGERSFPRLTAPEPIFDEAERQALRQAGLDLAGAGDRLPDEMLLFYQVVTRARRRLVLSYPAVDERGQALLPSSFLAALLDCFRPGAIPVERRSMLLERYDQDVPLSPAEYRVQLAVRSDRIHAFGAEPDRMNAVTTNTLPAELAANLAAAAELARQRCRTTEHNPYDGLFRDTAVIGEVAALFGPEKVFSPTALEDYVACPFRFFLRHVLRLEPLEEPREEIEVTRRGQAFHRALSRLHGQLRAEGTHQPTEAVDDLLLDQLQQAVEEYAARASSPASRQLWRLEGQRLMRVARRYRGHWEKFREPWLSLEVAPRPAFFEIDFGLPPREGQAPAGPLIIRADGIEVRVSGRIDRVDVAELEGGTGFWIIDYKTGRSSHYTSNDLSEFRRLQLTLYALAVEEVLLAGHNARPLGLAYWLVTDSGPKVVLPARGQVAWLSETQRWREVRERLQRWVATLAAHIRRGAFPLQPRSETCTQTCDFSQICRITQARSVGKQWDLPLPT
jgi:ATP-dependent helicase/DNAse subunit B